MKVLTITNSKIDSLTVCNWMWSMTVSPLKERNYRGDTALESKFFSMATGIEKTEEELDRDAERIFNLHKAMTIKQMGWDITTGAPTRATLERLGMKEVADELDTLGLLPN